MSVDSVEVRGGSASQTAVRVRLPVSTLSIGAVVAAVDFAIIAGTAIAAAYAYHILFRQPGVHAARYAALGAICFLNFVALQAARRSYSFEALAEPRRQLRNVATAWGIVILVASSLLFAAKVGEDVSRVTVAFFAVLALLSLLIWRGLLVRWLPRAVEAGWIRGRLVVLIADESEVGWRHSARTLRRLGYFPAATLIYHSRDSAHTIETLAEDAIRIARKEAIHSIMLLANWSDKRVIDRLALHLRILPLPVNLLPDHRMVERFGNDPAAPGLPTAVIQRTPLGPGERAVKRLFDVCAAAVGLALLSPLFLVVAALVKLDSRGPVFFRQARNGFDGRQFRILKFRTMNVLEETGEIRQATRHDQRVTRVGRWLRKTSIDELPQLWNVVRGEMSVVGPRPHAAAHNEQFQKLIATYAFRHHVKPGVTGWAQAHGLRGETKTIDLMEKRVEYDLYYINHWTFLLDLMIVLKTVLVVFRDQGAF